MGVRNYLIEGVSGTGKTAVCDALIQRGYQALHGDRTLAYQGDPQTGLPLDGTGHAHHIWDVDKVRAMAGDKRAAVTFFCGGSRNFHRFLDLFDQVFVLEVTAETLHQRLATRPQDEFGGEPHERAMILRLQAARADVPRKAIRIDANGPLPGVVDAILSQCGIG